MKIALLLVMSVIGPCLWGVSPADDKVPAASPATRPRQTTVTAGVAAPDSGNDKPADATGAPKFSSEAKWGTAGYNNNEIYYSVIVTNQDTRIIRCITEIQGYYFENGTKFPIADRQLTTVFPNQPTQVGIWMDMDQSSGATYAVKCHPV